jgi:glycosyltransferase involved in cell wall biosynthesis
MLMTRCGEFLNYLPPSIRVVESICYHTDKFIINCPPLIVLKELFKQSRFMVLIRYMLAYAKYKFLGDDLAVLKMMFKNDSILQNEKFDLAIAYAGPSLPIDYFTRYKIRANKYVGWIHFDAAKISIPKRGTLQIYESYNKIFVVAEQGLKHFGDKFPMLRSKLSIFHNVINPRNIRLEATYDESFDDNYHGIRLLCVGRISSEKGQALAIEALSLLRNEGMDARLYLIGEGAHMKHCRDISDNLGIDDSVKFLGLKVNPYPFMRDCDVYIQPSRYEGFCISLAEARCFDIPIVSTDFTGAAEQLKGRYATRIVGFSAREMADAIVDVIKESHVRCPRQLETYPSDINKLLSILK